MKLGRKKDTEFENMLRIYSEIIKSGDNTEELKMHEKAAEITAILSKAAFFESEKKRQISYSEFMVQQIRYISKLWWLMQFAVIAGIYVFITAADGTVDVQRILGAAAPLFVIFMMPELWKNRTAQSMEMESASYYSLRQVYAARMTAFAFADGFILTVFVIAALTNEIIGAEEILIQFLLPMMVTCCICFRMLCSKSISSESVAIFLSLIWTGFWLVVVVNSKVYDMISMPLWAAALTVSIIYFVYVVRNVLMTCGEYWENDMREDLWN